MSDNLLARVERAIYCELRRQGEQRPQDIEGVGSHKLALGGLTFLDGKFDLEAVARRVARIPAEAAICALVGSCGVDLVDLEERRRRNGGVR
jgi:hypothetical protein